MASAGAAAAGAVIGGGAVAAGGQIAAGLCECVALVVIGHHLKTTGVLKQSDGEVRGRRRGGHGWETLQHSKAERRRGESGIR